MEGPDLIKNDFYLCYRYGKDVLPLHTDADFDSLQLGILFHDGLCDLADEARRPDHGRDVYAE